MPSIVRNIVVALAVFAAGHAGAATIFLTDFTAGNPPLGPHGGWAWDSPTRTLLTAATNTPADYLQQSYDNAIDAADGNAIRLTGTWVPDIVGGNGTFTVQLDTLPSVAVATFTYGQFVGGATVDAPIVWPAGSSTIFTNWFLIGGGSPSTTSGDFTLTSMSIVTVPEPTAATAGLAVIGGLAGIGLARRRPAWR